MTHAQVTAHRAPPLPGKPQIETNRKTRQVFTIEVDNNWFGVPIEKVRTVFRTNSITAVPMAPPAIAGLINVRGEVLTAIHLATYLGLNKTNRESGFLLVGIEHRDEDFGLIIDKAGDILDVEESRKILLPTSQSETHKMLPMPTYRIADMLLPLLDIEMMLFELTKQRH